MNKFLKIGLYAITLIVIMIVGLLSYVKLALPDVGPAPEIKVVSTPETIERGRYLANAVAVCMDCHSTRDWTRFAGPAMDGTWGKGGERFDQTMGFPGVYFSKNITPAGIGNWTDGEIYRAITSGVTKDGKPIFSVMPHAAYGKMDTKDIHAIIAYLRTLKPIDNKVSESVSDFPMNFILNTIPQKANPQAIPSKSDTVLYGKYLFTSAACGDCHTKMDKGTPIAGMELAGGFEFPLPSGTVRSANITSDSETGIGNWSRTAFVSRFKAYSDSSYSAPKIEGAAFNTVMPWLMYADMTEEDLSAIYAYLKTVKPIKNQVERFSPRN